MRASSAKAKGRRLGLEAKELILRHLTELLPDDLYVVPSGVPGEDLKLSPKAKELLPFVFEFKNQEKISIWACLEQTHSRREPDRMPALIFKRNRSDLYITLNLEDFMKVLTGRKNGVTETKER